MNRNTLRDIREILDKKNVEQNGENGKDHIKFQMANLKADVERVVEMIKESEENTKKRFKEIMDLLRNMHEENHAEMANLKAFLRSSQDTRTGSSISKSSESTGSHYDDEDIANNFKILPFFK